MVRRVQHGGEDNLLVAQIFRHGDDLRGIEKLILVILIAHVSFARAALICRGKQPLLTGARFRPDPARQDLYTASHEHSSV